MNAVQTNTADPRQHPDPQIYRFFRQFWRFFCFFGIISITAKPNFGGILHYMKTIEIRNLSKVYDLNKLKVNALQNISLSVEQGDFIAIMGPSGSGKSTLMNIIGLLDHPTSGTYFLNNKDISIARGKDQARIRNREIGFVFQNFNLLPRLSAMENVILPMVYAHVSTKERKEKAKRLLADVGLSQRAKHKPMELSGGEKQRVAIARALVNNPSIILADEPTGNLDSKSGHEIMEVFKKLNGQGKIVILVTHAEEVAAYARRRIKLFDGRII